jgi:hypothetical protein
MRDPPPENISSFNVRSTEESSHSFRNSLDTTFFNNINSLLAIQQQKDIPETGLNSPWQKQNDVK